MENVKPKLIVILGPTATGKSDLAVDLSLYIQKTKQITCEIISADSRQIYTDLNLGTGKITESEMKGVKHHMLDVVHPLQKYTVVDYKKQAQKCIGEIVARGNLPIICGGTGLYIDNLVHDISLPEVPPNEKLRAELEEKSIEELTSFFYNLNKEQPHKVDLKNKRRIIRAIEILTVLGHIPAVETSDTYDVIYFGLDMEDKLLHDRIKKRIDKRLDQGMIQESEDLLAAGKLTYDRMRELGLEYAFIADLLEKKISVQDFKETLFYAIWHYAKRQRTWFRKNSDVMWFLWDTEKGYDMKKIFSLVDAFV